MATKSTKGGTTWSDTGASWRRAQEELAAKFRPLYLAELERFAETLRPRFESGELHGCTDDDINAGARLEALCMEHFGLRVVDPATADMILAVSPSAGQASDPNQEVSSFNASYACAWDVLAVARARGWYTPAADEEPALEASRWAHEARATEAA